MNLLSLLSIFMLCMIFKMYRCMGLLVHVAPLGVHVTSNIIGAGKLS